MTVQHLVIGASGQVGEHLLDGLHRRGKVAAGTYYSKPASGLFALDIRDAVAVASLLTRLKPEFVYLPAALTNVDYCELHRDQAYAVNVVGTCNVAKTANEIDARLIFFSSDYVFDGRNGPYSENDPVNPLSEYGRQKVFAEHYISFHVRNFLIIRTTVVFAWERQGKNFVQRLIQSVRARQAVDVPVDQIGSPTYTPNLVDVVLDLVEIGATGLYNVVGPQLMNRYEFALTVAQVFDLEGDFIRPVSTSELPQPAPRPLNAGLSVDKVRSRSKVHLMIPMEGLQEMRLTGV